MKKWALVLGGLVVVPVGLAIAGIFVLSLIDLNGYKGFIAGQVKEATGRNLTMAGNLELDVVSLTPSVSAQGITLANAPWGSRTEMARLDKLSVQIQLIPLLFGNVVVDHLILEGVDLLAETDKQGRGNWEFDSAGPPAGEGGGKIKPPQKGGDGVWLPMIRLVRLKDIKISYVDGVGGEAVTVNLDSLKLAAAGDDTPFDVTAAGSYNGAPYHVSGRLGAIGDLMAGKPFLVQLKASALETELVVDGQVKTLLKGRGVDLGLVLDIPKTAHTAKAVAAVVPGFDRAAADGVPALPAGFSGRLQDLPDGYVLNDLSLSIGDSDLSGRAAVSLGGVRPKLSVDLHSNFINIDQLTSSPSEPATSKTKARAKGEARSKKAEKTRVFSADPLPFDALGMIDADVRFVGKKVLTRGLYASNPRITLSLSDGRLSVEPLSIEFGDGTIGGEVLLDIGGKIPVLAAELKVRRVDYGRLLGNMEITDITRGRLDGDINVKSKGASVRTLMAGLDGKARLVAENGRIDSQALNILSADVLSIIPGIGNKGGNDLRCGVVDFDIDSGKAAVKALVFETGGISVIGTGDVDLKSEGLNLRIDPRAKKGSLIKAVMVPFTIGGVLADPSFAPDAVETTKTIVGGLARVAGAVATSGVSLLAEGAAKRIVGVYDKTDYCKVALAGKKVTPKKRKEKKPLPEKADKRKGAGGAMDSLKKELDGLFSK